MQYYRNVKLVNPLVLIDEVKKRPMLYEVPMGTVENRRNAWNDISEKLIVNFQTFEPAKQEAVVKELYAKWKSLRDNYRKELRIQRQLAYNPDLPKRKRIYQYYKQLSFLEEFCKAKGTDETQIQKEEEEEVYSPLPTNNDSSLLNTEIDIKNEPVSPVKMEESNEMEFGDMGTPAQTVNSDFPSHHEQNTQDQNGFAKIEYLLNEVVTMKRAQMSHDENGNEKFLLSLLPFMEKLPAAANMKLRVEMMKLVHNCHEEQRL